MQAYLLRRFAVLFITLFSVVTLVFIGMRVAPGDPARAILGRGASAEALERFREKYGLNDPIYVQYFNMVSNYIHGDFGRSLKGRPVKANIAYHLPYTIQLVFAGMLVSLLIGVPIGIFSALRPNIILDIFFRLISVIGISTPSFWIATILLLIFSLQLRWFPVTGAGTFTHLVLPALAIGFQGAAIFMRITRATLLTILEEDYIIYARAKGQTEFKVIFFHALRNAAIPNMTMLGLMAGSFLASVVLIEIIFTRPGLGKLLIDSVLNSDYATIQATSILLATLIVVINTTTDVAYGLLDPTIRYD